MVAALRAILGTKLVIGEVRTRGYAREAPGSLMALSRSHTELTLVSRNGNDRED